MNIAIITDSTCDLGPGAEALFHIDIVPLLVTFGKDIFLDGVDLTSEEFYARLSKADALPTTSQPSPLTFQELFRRRLDEGKDVVGVFISSTLSGTYQTALMARNQFTPEEQERIILIDSRHSTGNLGILVIEACRKRDQGAEAAAIRDHIAGLIPRLRLYSVFDTLKYLRMGGRLSAAGAVAGNLLNITPVVTLYDGTISVVAKIRRSPNAFRKWLREKILGDLPDPGSPAIFLHSNNPALTAPLREEFKYLFAPENCFDLCLGSVIGTHTGPGAHGLVYVSRDKQGLKV